MSWRLGAPRADRDEMIETIEREVEMTRHLTGRSSLDPRVLRAMATVPRDEFVPEQSRGDAFGNHPLPIGEGQTISQPFMVALMTDLLEPEPEHVVLEVGTGSGYQAAILAQLVERVYTVEVIAALAKRAEATLKRLGYANVSVSCHDGSRGWPEHAPYDGIVVTAAAPAIPQALVDQLKPGGRLVVPVGRPYMPQELRMVEKDARGQATTRDILGVAFVPLTGEQQQ
ncbi:MAG: protein-L-isoaspartate(D-aspartate) O-methyltransferase [Desulfuromonadales bacterium]|nr:protein-L-isoaspartate(D-aspartate) O-methyltransferase [Desulfuromonadales bacterium]NIR33199.1 protein-L-isoaspartate(D-aspartate) O-methyltransferase [Desulfuromonadales bacterium]NIS41985.1 protein-L-isoaspartate(D-aspartate) O-methyltransferase [Desulfuromonadales bacterium]